MEHIVALLRDDGDRSTRRSCEGNTEITCRFFRLILHDVHVLITHDDSLLYVEPALTEAAEASLSAETSLSAEALLILLIPVALLSTELSVVSSTVAHSGIAHWVVEARASGGGRRRRVVTASSSESESLLVGDIRWSLCGNWHLICFYALLFLGIGEEEHSDFHAVCGKFQLVEYPVHVVVIVA